MKREFVLSLRKEHIFVFMVHGKGLSKQQILESKIIDWAATRLDEAVLDPRDGYYPFEIIADAYAKGAEHAEKKLKEKMREKYFDNAKLLTGYINKSLKSLKEANYSPTKVFISLSVNEAKIIFAINDKAYLSDAFLDRAYEISSDIKTHSFDNGLSLRFGFIGDNENLNYANLQADGFGIALDLETNKPIY